MSTRDNITEEYNFEVNMISISVIFVPSFYMIYMILKIKWIGIVGIGC